MHRLWVLCLSLTLPCLALAQQDETRLWSGEVQAGAVLTGGNTDIQRLNGQAVAQRNGDTLRNTLNLEGIYALNSGTEVARRFSIANQVDYKLTDRGYLFNKLRYEGDRYAPFVSIFTGSVGYGHRFIQQQQHQLTTEAGLGYRELRRADVGPNAGEVLGEELLILSANYRWRPQPSAFFNQNISTEMSRNRTIVRSVSRVQAMLTDQASLAFVYDQRFNSAVPEPFSRTDTTATVNIGYLF